MILLYRNTSTRRNLSYLNRRTEIISYFTTNNIPYQIKIVLAVLREEKKSLRKNGKRVERFKKELFGKLNVKSDQKSKKYNNNIFLELSPLKYYFCDIFYDCFQNLCQ